MAWTGAASTAAALPGSSLDDKIKQRIQARQQRGTSKYTPEVLGTTSIFFQGSQQDDMLLLYTTSAMFTGHYSSICCLIIEWRQCHRPGQAQSKRCISAS